MHRHFLVVVGNWKFEDWHLYRWCRHYSARNASITWLMWDRVL